MADTGEQCASWGSQTGARYLALGKYIHAFSRLQHEMRIAIRHLFINRYGEESGNLANLLMGRTTARDLADSFFAIFAEVGDLNAADRRVAKKLRIWVDKEIALRNKVAHGDWLIDLGADDQLSDSMLVKTDPGRQKGPPVEVNWLPLAEMESWSEQLDELRRFVGEYALYAGSLWRPLVTPRRVSEILIIRNGLVVREGSAVGNSKFHGLGP